MRRRSKLLTAEDDLLLEHVRRRYKDARLADLRAEGMAALVESAAEMGLALDWRRLNRIAASIGGRGSGEFFVPPAVVEVCRGLARHRGRPFDLALDPFARSGLLLAALTSEGIAVAGAGRNVYGHQMEIAGAVTTGLPIDLKPTPAPVPDAIDPGLWDIDDSADSELAGDLIGDKLEPEGLELVVCCPPWNAVREEWRAGDARYRHSQDQLLYEAHRQLMSEGMAVFLMPGRFFYSPRAAELRADMAREGDFKIDAAFHLAAGSIPGFHGSAYIVVGSAGRADRMPHTEQGRLFVAELDGDEKRTAAILQNLVEGQDGATLALGAFVDAGGFRGFPSLLASQDLEHLQRGRDAEFVTLKAVASRIGPADRKSAAPGSLFIRKVGSERVEVASTDPGVVEERPSRWVAIELDDERAEPEYLANWLNAKPGRVARRAVAFGSSLVQVRERDIGDLLVHLPPIEEQRERLRFLARARELKSICRSVEQRAFLPSVELASLEESLSFDQREREVSLEEWSETLPFPLASVLRRYRQEADDPERAANALLHFFEAFGEFWAIILLSALEQAGEIPGVAASRIRADLPDGHSLERSSMGTWPFVGGKAAKWLREQVLPGGKDQDGNDREPNEDPLRILATRSSPILRALLSKRIPAILQRATDLRNRSRGHGGATSETAATRLLDVLHGELSQLREVVAPAFDVLKFYRLGDQRKKRGVRDFAVEVLQGSNTAFLKERLKLEDDPDFGSLVLSAGEGRSLPLLPLIQMWPPKASDSACYFYSRVENDTACYVSYHQGDDIEGPSSEAPLEFLQRWRQDP